MAFNVGPSANLAWNQQKARDSGGAWFNPQGGEFETEFSAPRNSSGSRFGMSLRPGERKQEPSFWMNRPEFLEPFKRQQMQQMMPGLGPSPNFMGKRKPIVGDMGPSGMGTGLGDLSRFGMGSSMMGMGSGMMGGRGNMMGGRSQIIPQGQPNPQTQNLWSTYNNFSGY